LPREPDGGVLVEPQTRTVVRLADPARHLLGNTTRYPSWTYVVCGPSGSLHLRQHDHETRLTGPAAAYVGPGTEAHIDADAPDTALLVCTQTHPYPSGYHAMSPQGIHAARYAEIARLNARFEAGRMSPGRLPRPSLEKLRDAGLIASCPEDPGTLRWTVSSRDALERQIQGLGFRSRTQQGVLEAYESTRRQQLSHRGRGDQGYDVSGLAWEGDGALIYRLADRVDPWRQRPGEWLLSSITYGGVLGPPGLGISMVSSAQRRSGRDEPFGFRQLRPAERLHRHPLRAEGSMLEVYHVAEGRAVLLTLQDGKPLLHRLDTHDMAAIQPGVPHCLLAAQAPYRHVVLQTPSTFQYGFAFKESLRFEDYGLNHTQLEKAAVHMLRS
jgi:hypothetical protein